MFKIVQEILIYNIFGVLNSGLPFLLLPILTNYLNPEELGFISLFTVTLGILNVIVGFNTHYPISIKFGKKSTNVINMYFVSGILISASISIFLMCLVLIFGDYINNSIHISNGFMCILIVLAFFQSISTISLALLQIKRKVFVYNIALLVGTVINSVLSLVLIVYVGFDWIGRLIGIAVGTLATTSIGIYLFLKSIENRIAKNDFVPPLPIALESFKIGSSLFIYSISGVVIAFFDRYVITLYCDLESLGFYTLAYSFGMIPSIYATTMNRAWFPHFNKFVNGKTKTHFQLSKYILILIISIAIVAMVVVFSAPFIFQSYIGQEYSKSLELIPWLATAYVFEGTCTILSGAFLISNRGSVLSRLVLISAVFNSCLIIYFVMHAGVLGAAKATLYTYALLLISYLAFYPRKSRLWIFAKKTRV